MESGRDDIGRGKNKKEVIKKRGGMGERKKGEEVYPWKHEERVMRERRRKE